jgi:GAF domain-containing protein
MQTAPLPENEAQRLSALHSYGVLDTHGYAAVDALVQVASQVCQTPIALVTLLDADRAWIMSRLGLNATEMPRELAFCCYSVLQPDEVAHVPDTLLDERFCENPLVLGEP